MKLPIDPRYLYYLALVAAGILAAAVLLILWNRTLRLRVSAKTAELSTALASLQTQADRLRVLSAHHDSVREEERAHVAREIHDELGRSEERRVGKECRSRCDWSSDVCSSDLPADAGRPAARIVRPSRFREGGGARARRSRDSRRTGEIGRASCRERV